MIRFLLCLFLLISILPAAEVPEWVLVGILHVETDSAFKADGSIDYVNRKRGAHGERGPFQMTHAAFDSVKDPGEKFESLSSDLDLAKGCARRYLLWLDKHWGHGDWVRNVMMYNAGPGRVSRRYANKVLKAAGR